MIKDLLPKELTFFNKERPKISIPTMDTLLNLTDEELKQLDIEIENYNNEIQTIKEHNNNVHTNWTDLIFPKKFNLFTKEKRFTRTEHKHFEFIVEQLGYEEFNKINWKDSFWRKQNIELNLLNSCGSLSEFIIRYRNNIKAKEQKAKEKEDILEKYKIHLLQKGKELNLDISNYSSIDLYFSDIESTLKDKWAKEKYTDGIEIYIDCCDFCSSWTVGEHRCSCGNRRMSLIIEGDSLNGFYAYPEAY